MNDKQFVEEYVKRYYAVHKLSKIRREMVSIVLSGELVNVSSMFSNEDIDNLLRSAPVSAWVYKFVRDNQTLWIAK